MFLEGSPPEVFGVVLPREIEARWRASGVEQVIAQAELLPILLALLVWRARLSGIYVIWWVDNDRARQGLVNGYSRSLRNARLIDDTLLFMSTMCTYSWYARVPTECNVADLPSRLEWDKLLTVLPGARRGHIDPGMWPRA